VFTSLHAWQTPQPRRFLIAVTVFDVISVLTSFVLALPGAKEPA